jgi:hypothetical protein
MSTTQAFFLGIMVFLTPSLLVVACWLVWLPRASKMASGPDQESDPGTHRDYA